MGSRPGCSDSLPESLLPSRAATPTLAVRRFDRGSGHVGLGYAVCPVGTAWVGKRFWRSELRASSSCPIRCVISSKWAIPPPIWPTREAPSAASSSDAPGGGENAMISESIEPSGTSMPSLKYALIARAVCSPDNLRHRTRSSRCAARRFRVSRSRSRKLVGQAFDNASRCGVTSCWQKLLTSSNRRSTKSRWDRASLAAVNSRCSSTWCSPKSRGVERIGTFAYRSTCLIVPQQNASASPSVPSSVRRSLAPRGAAPVRSSGWPIEQMRWLPLGGEPGQLLSLRPFPPRVRADQLSLFGILSVAPY